MRGEAQNLRLPSSGHGTAQFHANTRRVVHETIDGETILVDLESGNYYSLPGSGSEIWAYLSNGYAVDETARELSRRYDAPSEAIEEAVRGLASRLVEEGLLEVGAPRSRQTVSTSTGESDQFTPPVLEKFTDMQHFLLVDPIHEVDELGWPHVPPQV